MTAPIIIAGITGAETTTPRRYVQFWGLAKVAGIQSMECLAEAADPDVTSLYIRNLCPPDWFPTIFAAFKKTMAGQPVEPTHTVAWGYGGPTFTPISPADIPAPLFELETS